MIDKVELTNLVNRILEDGVDDQTDKQEIIDLLLDKKVAENINTSHEESYGLGDRISDKIAKVAGSWTFIITFVSILAFWIVTNAILMTKSFDPFPFILLNLVLSCISALQAPVIMMSQNRQEIKDRIRADNDYKINLKSELIVEDVHYKLDQLISNQEHIISRLKALEEEAEMSLIE